MRTQGTAQVTDTAVAAVDAQGVVTAWSRGARLLLGYAPAEVVGRPAADLLAARLPDAARKCGTRRQAWAGRVVLRDRDGRQVDAEVRACPLMDAEQHVQWFLQAEPPREDDGADLVLQRSLLPHHRRTQLAVETGTRYLPAGLQAGVGGDWFDVIPLSGARVALVVGDVVGHGIHASAAMGRLRTAVRTLADVDLSPDELLTQLDDLILEEIEEGIESAGEVGATCLYAVYDPVSGHCTMASAGHPAPALVTPDGSARFLSVVPGPPLGVGGLPFEAAETGVPEDSLLVLFTDGLVETRHRDIGSGQRALLDALSRPAPSLEATCDRLVEALLPGRPDDDAALLVARTHIMGDSHVASWNLPADPAVVVDARRQAAGQLTAWGLQDASDTTELIVSELVTNAIRHARPPIQLRLIHDAALICEVSDASSTTPHLRRARELDEGGRGLYLVGQLAERWGTRHTPDGKTIWAEQPPPLHERLRPPPAPSTGALAADGRAPAPKTDRRTDAAGPAARPAGHETRTRHTGSDAGPARQPTPRGTGGR
jgi:PAS domain S-box-containing protein